MVASSECGLLLATGDLLLKPIVEVAGQDISHWFDPKTGDVSSVGTRLAGVGGSQGGQTPRS